MFGIGFGELIIILIVILLFVGPKKLPEMARMLGKAMGELRRASDDITNEFNKTIREVNIESAKKELSADDAANENKESEEK